MIKGGCESAAIRHWAGPAFSDTGAPHRGATAYGPNLSEPMQNAVTQWGVGKPLQASKDILGVQRLCHGPLSETNSRCLASSPDSRPRWYTHVALRARAGKLRASGRPAATAPRAACSDYVSRRQPQVAHVGEHAVTWSGAVNHLSAVTPRRATPSSSCRAGSPSRAASVNAPEAPRALT